MVGAILGALLAGATVAGSAYLGHGLQLVHIHVLGFIPLGAIAIGAGAAIGVAVAIRLTSSYDTSGYRLLAQIAGVSAYCAILLLDYTRVPLLVGSQKLPAAQLMGVGGYFRSLAIQEGAKLTKGVLAYLQISPKLDVWIGLVQLLIEVIFASVATGWAISFLTGVPLCMPNRRFYDLKQIIESADVDGLRDWERAIGEHRPIEARAIFARARAASVTRGGRQWVRVVIHQCSICRSSRVRIERRRRFFGFVLTTPARELVLNARGSTAVPD